VLPPDPETLTGQPRAHTLDYLNEQLEKFRHIYNRERPHWAWTAGRPPPAMQHRRQHRPAANNGDHWRRRILPVADVW
jgi:hypothetical protein